MFGCSRNGKNYSLLQEYHRFLCSMHLLLTGRHSIKLRVEMCSRECRLGNLSLLAMAVFVAWFCYRALQPTPPKPLRSITAPRVQLSDGRFLAYKEAGIPKERAAYKIVLVHGFGRSRHDIPHISESLTEELGVYFVAYDRAGYGQSDPNPGRSIKNEAFDIQELADILGLGPKFYVIATSIGGYSAWACLKYIPNRLAGVAMLAPVTNYWWPGIPFSDAIKAFRTQPFQDQIAIGLVHYAPWLTYWWNTQKLFSRASVMESRMDFLNGMDREIIERFSRSPFQREARREAIQQGIYESVIRDMMNMFSNWEFDPADLKDPFTENEGSVHIWHGDEDYLVPLMLQRYIQRRLPWVHLHVLPGAGHFLNAVKDLPEKILRTMLLKESE